MGAGVVLIATFFLPASYLNNGASGESASAKPREFEVPVLANKQQPIEPADRTSTDKASNDAGLDQRQNSGDEDQRQVSKKTPEAASVPKDKTLTLTIPRMARVKQADIPTTVGTDEEKLRNHAAIHLKGTGFPWEHGSNVYMAGHRLGYPATRSFLAFYDLSNLQIGDDIFIKDTKDRKYSYKVSRIIVVDPSDIFVTEPVKGKDVVTLQTCTLPDYSQRLIVQAEKVT